MPYLTHDQMMQRIGWWALDQDSPTAKNTREIEFTCSGCEEKWLRVFWAHTPTEDIVICPHCGELPLAETRKQ